MSAVLNLFDAFLVAYRQDPDSFAEDVLLNPVLSTGTLLPNLEDFKTSFLVRVRTIGVLSDTRPMDCWVFVKEALTFRLCEELCKKYPGHPVFQVAISEGDPVLARHSQLKFDVFGEGPGGVATMIAMYNFFMAVGIEIEGGAIFKNALMRLRTIEFRTEREAEEAARKRTKPTPSS